jgi:hypothetical protein
MKRNFIILGCVLALALMFAISRLIWIPDLWRQGRRVVHAFEDRDGNKYQVMEWWNRVDFYSVEFVHSCSNGATHTALIDSDASKWWSCEIALSKTNQDLIVVTRNKNIEVFYSVSNRTLIRPNSLQIPARLVEHRTLSE